MAPTHSIRVKENDVLLVSLLQPFNCLLHHLNTTQLYSVMDMLNSITNFSYNYNNYKFCDRLSSTISALPPASWTMSREGRAAFLKERLAGAQHFDIDEVSDQSSPYPHMIPTPHIFQDLVAKVRVQSHTCVILHFIVTDFFNSTVTKVNDLWSWAF